MPVGFPRGRAVVGGCWRFADARRRLAIGIRMPEGVYAFPCRLKKILAHGEPDCRRAHRSCAHASAMSCGPAEMRSSVGTIGKESKGRVCRRRAKSSRVLRIWRAMSAAAVRRGPTHRVWPAGQALHDP